jgi:hypothetical protein
MNCFGHETARFITGIDKETSFGSTHGRGTRVRAVSGLSSSAIPARVAKRQATEKVTVSRQIVRDNDINLQEPRPRVYNKPNAEHSAIAVQKKQLSKAMRSSPPEPATANARHSRVANPQNDEPIEYHRHNGKNASKRSSSDAAGFMQGKKRRMALFAILSRWRKGEKKTFCHKQFTCLANEKKKKSWDLGGRYACCMLMD